jgi:hypothetical protein
MDTEKLRRSDGIQMALKPTVGSRLLFDDYANDGVAYGQNIEHYNCVQKHCIGPDRQIVASLRKR